MKNRIRLTESQLHRVIKESVNKMLNEHIGFDSDLVDRVERAKELMGADALVDAITGYLGESVVRKMMDFIERVYEIKDSYEEDEY